MAACYLLLYFQKSVPYFNIGAKEFLAAFFMMAGYYYKRDTYGFENHSLIIPFAIVLLALGTEFWQCGMLSLTWQKVFPYSFSALVGTMMVFAISKIISKSESIMTKSMVYIGNHTLEILTWHFLSFKLVSLLIIWIYGLPIERLAEFPVIGAYAYHGWWIIYLLTGVVFPIFFMLSKKLI